MSNEHSSPAEIDLRHDGEPAQIAANLRELGPATHANAQLLAEAFMLMSRAGALGERRQREHAVGA